MASGLYVIPAGADAWATYIDQPITALNDGFILDQAGVDATGALNTVAVFASATSFTVPGDQTTVYVPGRKLRIVHAGGTSYCEVLSSVFGATTTVTITNATAGPATITTPVTSVAFGPTYSSLAGNEHPNFRVLNRTTTTVVASTASVTSDSTLYTYSVPAGVMGTSGILRLSLYGDMLNNSAGIATAFKFLIGTSTVIAGSTNTCNVPLSANRRYWNSTVVVQNVASASAQRVSGIVNIGAPFGDFSQSTAGAAILPLQAVAYGTAAEASTAAMTIAFMVRVASTATTVDLQLRHAVLELAQ